MPKTLRNTLHIVNWIPKPGLLLHGNVNTRADSLSLSEKPETPILWTLRIKATMHERLKDSQLIRVLINIEASTHEEGSTVRSSSTMTRKAPLINLNIRKHKVKNLRTPDLINSHGLKLRSQLIERGDINDGSIVRWYLA
jgi:hypothetical protein